MTKEQVIKTLQAYNEWRRDNDGIYEMPHPKELGIAVDTAIELLSEEEENPWILWEDQSFTISQCLRMEVLFDTGEICKYNDDWPIAEATHFRKITPLKK